MAEWLNFRTLHTKLCCRSFLGVQSLVPVVLHYGEVFAPDKWAEAPSQLIDYGVVNCKGWDGRLPSNGTQRKICTRRECRVRSLHNLYCSHFNHKALFASFYILSLRTRKYWTSYFYHGILQLLGSIQCEGLAGEKQGSID